MELCIFTFMNNRIIKFKTSLPYTHPNSDRIYIGRANSFLGLPQSKWHNPFPMKNENERKEVLRKFLFYILDREDLLEDLHEIDGKKLICYCAPKYCHGDILIRLREYQIKNLPYHTQEILDWIDSC